MFGNRKVPDEALKYSTLRVGVAIKENANHTVNLQKVSFTFQRNKTTNAISPYHSWHRETFRMSIPKDVLYFI